MNVVVLSTGRNRRWKRHSIAIFDRVNNNNNNDMKSPQEQPSSERITSRRRDALQRCSPDINKHLCVIKNLVRDCNGVDSSDMEMLRKSCMERVAASKSTSDKIFELKSAIYAVNEIPISSTDGQWLAQYQYILNWCYCQLRFISDPSERRRLFLDVKEKYRRIFEKLHEKSDLEKLPTCLHFSQICYEYAELADQESLSWCMEIISNAKAALSAPSSGSSTLSRQASIGGSRVEKYELNKAEIKRRKCLETIELIRGNILKAEGVRVSFGIGDNSEKFVM